MFRPRRLASMAALLVCGMFLLAFDRGSQSIGIFLFVLCVLLPIFLYRGLGRVVDGNSQLTDPKTVEFGQSRLVVVGPDWRSEMPWTRFHGFSEDADYFYLHLSKTGLASVIPKSSFTPEQRQKFREYAKSGIF